MTIFLTILAGVCTYIIGQLIMKLIIEPIHEFKKAIADISHALIEYANVYTNPGVTGEESEKNASNILRKLSSQLNAQMFLIPCYDTTAKYFGLPPRKNIAESTKYLIGLSNGVFKSASELATKNGEKADKICDLLGIYSEKKNED